jgi:hypothetical protein
MSFFFLALLLSTAHAVPTQMGHQGRVLDVDGLPAEGPYTLDFHLYDAAEEGTMVWSELHDVDLINGYYSLVLGADELGNPLEDELLRDYELHLELTVGDDEPLSPRQALNAVPYARLSATATSVNGGPVNASDVSIGGALVIDSSGAWVGTTPTMSWSDLSDTPEDVDTVLSEDEVDAFCENNGYAIASDLAAVASTGSWSDLSDTPEDVDTVLSEDEVDAFCENNGYALATDLASIATSGSYDDLTGVPPVVGLNIDRFDASGSFTVPAGVTSLTIYVTGGGGGGSNGESTALDLGSHSHAVDAHSHNGTGHTHDSGTHTHSTVVSGTTVYDPCATTAPSYSGSVCVPGYVTSGGGTSSTGAASGISGDSAVSTNTTGLTTGGAESESVTVPHNGGDGGSGGGMSALLTVSPGAECTISIGEGGDVGADGTETTISCGDASVECGGGSAGLGIGVDGDDGLCTGPDGTLLAEYKASRRAPGGGGAGGSVSGAGSGQSGSVTIRY